ncbi:sentrin sumo-specific, partial [Colletotrichum incanum]
LVELSGKEEQDDGVNGVDGVDEDLGMGGFANSPAEEEQDDIDDDSLGSSSGDTNSVQSDVEKQSQICNVMESAIPLDGQNSDAPHSLAEANKFKLDIEAFQKAEKQLSDPAAMLTDGTVALLLSLIQKEAKAANSLNSSRVLVTHPLWLELDNRLPSRLPKTTRRFLMTILHHKAGPGHWTLGIFDLAERAFRHYDPLPSRKTQSAVWDRIGPWIQNLTGNPFVPLPLPGPVQRDGVSYALFALEAGYKFLVDEPIGVLDVASFRARLLDSLPEATPRLFPSVNTDLTGISPRSGPPSRNAKEIGDDDDDLSDLVGSEEGSSGKVSVSLPCASNMANADAIVVIPAAEIQLQSGTSSYAPRITGLDDTEEAKFLSLETDSINALKRYPPLNDKSMDELREAKRQCISRLEHHSIEMESLRTLLKDKQRVGDDAQALFQELANDLEQVESFSEQIMVTVHDAATADPVKSVQTLSTQIASLVATNCDAAKWKKSEAEKKAQDATDRLRDVKVRVNSAESLLAQLENEAQLLSRRVKSESRKRKLAAFLQAEDED